VLLLITEGLSSRRVGSSELVSQAGLIVARLAQDSYGTADQQGCVRGVKTIKQTFPNPSLEDLCYLRFFLRLWIKSKISEKTNLKQTCNVLCLQQNLELCY